MPWLRHRLRDADVWAKVDADGTPVADSGRRVEIVYKPAPDAKVYRAGARNLTPAPGSEPVDFEPGPAAAPRAARAPAGAGPAPAPAPRAEPARPGASAGRSSQPEAPANAIHVWTDGACSGN